MAILARLVDSEGVTWHEMYVKDDEFELLAPVPADLSVMPNVAEPSFRIARFRRVFPNPTSAPVVIFRETP